VSCAFAQPGHWLGPVTELGRLGSSQPIPVGLNPAQKNKNKNKIIDPTWAISPAGPTCVAKGVWKKYILMPWS